MNSRKPASIGNLALVVMAAGVVTASADFTLETVGESAPGRLPDSLSVLRDPAPGREPKART